MLLNNTRWDDSACHLSEVSKMSSSLLVTGALHQRHIHAPRNSATSSCHHCILNNKINLCLQFQYTPLNVYCWIIENNKNQTWMWSAQNQDQTQSSWQLTMTVFYWPDPKDSHYYCLRLLARSEG